ncbi:MAG: carboxypeptidase regulatory-like domain-containing protein, partial [Abditibacteriota bacterium]|nr:carboxypeptidase regulatory-like domain-containing protein [Abditibacteriota bacterium]
LRNSIFEYCLASGTVASPEGNPVAGAAVVIEVGFDTYEASADSDGRYEINLPRGAVGAIHVTAQGYATYNGTLNAFGESVVKNIILGGREIDSAGELKNAEVGDIVNVDFKAEALNNSGDFDDNSVYIKSGLFEGYKVIVPAGVTVAKGDTFTFEGSVKFDGEGKYAEAVSVTKASSGGSVRALGMINAMLESNTPVRVWGRVASADNGSYVINNGFENITVFAEKTQMPNVGAFVIVTGIAAPNGVRAIEVL